MRINRIVSCFLVAFVMMVALSGASSAQIGVGISVRIGPPPLPVYVQPMCPGDGYIWTPGYWAWSDDDGYYWVPGTWVRGPMGMLWTPGYWGWNNGLYAWNDGYWGPHIGFYGGINYGFGYTGVGFFGGYWQGDRFFYNRSVTNVNVTNITNVYNKTVINNNNTHVSFSGGHGGVRARPTREQQAAAHERHTPPIGPQVQHMQAARGNRQLLASVNHGRPAVAATARPGDFSHAVPARAAGGAYHPPKMSAREAAANRGGSSNRTSPNRTTGATNNRSTSSNRGPATQYRNNSRPEVSRGTSSSNHSTESRTNRGENRTNANAPVRQNDRSSSSTRRESAPPPHESRQPQREAAPPRRESPPPQRQAAPPRRESPPPPQRSDPRGERKPPTGGRQG